MKKNRTRESKREREREGERETERKRLSQPSISLGERKKDGGVREGGGG